MNVAIVGFGRIARHAHLDSFNKLINANVSYVMDTSPRILRLAKKNFGIKNVTSDFDQILNNDEITLVDICTPPRTHVDLCVRAAEAGKNILVEKPLAISVEEGKSIERAVLRNGVKLCVVHNYRYIPVVHYIKQLHLNGELGELLTIHEIVHSTTPNFLLETHWKIDSLLEFYHALDLMYFFCGDVKSISVKARSHPSLTYNVDYNAMFEFKNGIIGHLDWLKVSGCSLFQFGVYGSGQYIQADLYRDLYVKMSGSTLNPVERLRLSVKDFNNFIRKNFSSMNIYFSHNILISKYIDSIVNDTAVPVSIQESIAILKLYEHLIKSSRKNIKRPKVIEL